VRSNKILLNTIDTSWSANLAHIIGLIASDGYLAKDTYRIGLASKEIELIEIFRKVLSLRNKMGRHARGGEKEKKYLSLAFKDKYFYAFLNQIGITAAKSKTIQSVQIPDEFFIDFFRGLFDGDGTFWTHWDKRWPNSFVFHIAIYSASQPFIAWLKQRLSQLYDVKGVLHRGAGVYEIRHVKGDSKKLFEKMYYTDNLLYLKRKHLKIKTALDFDEQLKQSRLSKRRGSSVVELAPEERGVASSILARGT
jgi:hypothetical protein